MCEKAFTQASNLKKHILTHTGERAFQCYICEKSFTQVCSLKAHIVTHTGKRVPVWSVWKII